jgi:PhnB protein
VPVQSIPRGYHSVTPYLIVGGAAKAIDFYQRAFGATELFRMPSPDGQKLMHAEIKLGDSHVMLADEHPEWGALGPESLGGTPITMLLYVEDVDSVFPQALAAGATVVRPLADQFYGDRSGTVRDPFGHQWTIATPKEDVSPEEFKRRVSQFKQSEGA